MARGTAEFATWIAPGIGTRLAPHHEPAVGLSLGAEATLPLAMAEQLRFGPWLDVGADSLDLFRARGGVSILLGGLPDPGFVSLLPASHPEGALGLRLGLGWRGFSGLDTSSNGVQLEAKLTFGSRRYTETVEGGNAYDVCDGDGTIHTDHGERYQVGHWGPGFAFGQRVFVELERSLDAPTTQWIVGVEIDPATVWEAAREARTRDFMMRTRWSGALVEAPTWK
jgi:hypothetical protein